MSIDRLYMYITLTQANYDDDLPAAGGQARGSGTFIFPPTSISCII